MGGLVVRPRASIQVRQDLLKAHLFFVFRETDPRPLRVLVRILVASPPATKRSRAKSLAASATSTSGYSPSSREIGTPVRMTPGPKKLRSISWTTAGAASPERGCEVLIGEGAKREPPGLRCCGSWSGEQSGAASSGSSTLSSMRDFIAAYRQCAAARCRFLPFIKAREAGSGKSRLRRPYPRMNLISFIAAARNPLQPAPGNPPARP